MGIYWKCLQKYLINFSKIKYIFKNSTEKIKNKTKIKKFHDILISLAPIVVGFHVAFSKFLLFSYPSAHFSLYHFFLLPLHFTTPGTISLPCPFFEIPSVVLFWSCNICVFSIEAYISKYSKIATKCEKEHAVFIFLILHYFTPNNHSQICPLTWDFHNFNFLQLNNLPLCICTQFSLCMHTLMDI